MTIVYDLSIETYHADRESISKTGLDLIDKCPSIFRAWQSPDAPKREPKPGQLEGNLAHCAILEPEEFLKRYAVPPKDAPRKPTEKQWNAEKPSAKSVAAMEWWSQWAADNQQKLPITVGQYEVAMRQAESVRALPEIREALAKGHAEVSAYWTDPMTGVKCRCRPDFVHEVNDDSVILLDLKTFSSASAHEFRKQCARKRYECQAAMYSDGYAEAGGGEVLAFLFVCIELDFPFSANVFMLDEKGTDSGRRKYLKNLRTYSGCLKSDLWPGYADGVTVITLPEWSIAGDDDA